MPLQVLSPRPDELNPYDEARLVLDEWQREFPDATHVVLVLNADDVVTTIAGPAIRRTEATGLCMAAANMVMEE